ncbi:MAG TPA: hypothetical protein VHD31_03805 [Candidatus Paceibacterota bacterium]|nr:hypothetical protein [Candidatus Paceibacterota bacterium]
MDELEISGKRYISTRLAAKEHKYNADYIGQMIRAKKILGQKVGRSWYVEEKSLAAYFNKEAPVHVEEAVVVAKAPEPITQTAEVAEREPAVATVARAEAPATSASEELLAAAAKILEAAKNVAAPVPEHTSEPIVETSAEENSVEEKDPAPVEIKTEEVLPEVEQEVPARDSIHIPIRVTRPSFVALKNKAGLRYIDDDAPALPEVVKKTNRRSKVAATVTAPAQVQNEEVVITEYAPTQTSAGILVPAFSIAVLGVVAFVVVAVSSVMVNSNLLIEAGKAATAWYSLQ